MAGQQAAQIDPQTMWRILDVTRQLGAPVSLEQMLGQVIDAAREVLDAERGTVFLYDARTDELFSKVATGVGEIRFPADRGIAGQCARTRELLNIPDCYADERFNQEIDRKTGYRTRCLLTAPLIGIDDALVGVVQVLNKRDGAFDEQDERLASALAAQCAVALQRAALIEDQLVKQKLERDLTIARDIQQRVLPRTMPALPGYEVAGWSRPAEQTGGDIFDAFAVGPDRAMLVLCDATGHGIGPALSVTQVRSMFRIAARLAAPLDEVFQTVNDQLTDDLSDDRFVTAFIGELDAASHVIRYHSGGQAPLLHLRAADGECRMIEASALPMGIVAGGPCVAPPPIEMAPGDIFALVSDGVFEYMGPGGEQFGDRRTAEVLGAHRRLPMAGLIEALDREVLRFAAGQQQLDDMTVVLVKRDG